MSSQFTFVMAQNVQNWYFQNFETMHLFFKQFLPKKSDGKVNLEPRRYDIRWVLNHGAEFVAVGSDVALLTNMCRAHAADFKAHCESPWSPLPFPS